jgi:hypothetical protein
VIGLATYSYSREAAERLAIRVLKQVAGPLLLFLLVVVGDYWYLSAAKPVWEKLFHSVWIIFGFAAAGGMAFGLTFGLAKGVSFSLWPDAFDGRNSTALTSIPRGQIREIVVGPNDFTVVGTKRMLRIRATAEMDGYADLLESLSAWAPDALLRPVSGRALQKWVIPAVGILLYPVFTRFALAHPTRILELMMGIFLVSPILFWRARALPPVIRWVASGCAVLNAAVLFGVLYIMR